MFIGRKIVMGALLLGAVGGYASGFRSIACWRHRREVERQQVMQAVARTCAEAAVAAHVRQSAASPPSAASGR